MNIFFDTEFTGLVPNTTLISIGMITDNEQRFYAEFSDYNEDLCNDWIKENVLSNLLVNRKNWSTFFKFEQEKRDKLANFKGIHARVSHYLPDNTTFVYGDSKLIKDSLENWFYKISNNTERIQLISDVSHYDMTLLCNLFGGAFDLPSNINPVCYDICQDIWTFLEEDYTELSDKMYNSFDVSREELVDSINYDDEENKPSGNKHNSLYDAEVIRYLYKSLIGD
jgi:hypothetical protein